MYLHNATLSLILIISCSVAWASNQIVIKISPENKTVQDNIEAYIGEYKNQDLRTLFRLQPVVKKQATEACQALGYYGTIITTQLKSKQSNNPTLVVNVKLDEPVLLNNIVINIQGEAASVSQFKTPNNKYLKQGVTLNHDAYESAKTQIKANALRYGFFFGKFTQHQLLINPQQKTADINLEYQSGPRARLGKVTFTGKNNPFDDDLLNRFVNFPPNTPYDAALIAKLNNNLQSSGYFEDVRVDAFPTDQDHLELPVTAHVEAAKSRVLSTGVGVSTDIGPRAQLSWTRPWINSRGHSLGATTEISGPRQSISGWYQIPMEDPLTDNIRFTSGIQHENLVDTESTLYTLGVERNKQLDNGWMRTLFLRWQNEQYRIGEEEATRMFLTPGISLSYLKADNTFDPHKGYRLKFDLMGAKKGLIADADFIRYNASAKGLYTLAQKHRFLARAEVGGINTNDYQKIPPSLRFYAGGDQSVRGYNYQTLSPRDKDNENKKVGGRYLVTSSLEYQYEFIEKWRIATFIDKGNAMDSWSDGLQTGVGFGIRWVSPVGPIKVDIARGIEDNSIRLHFAIGPEL